MTPDAARDDAAEQRITHFIPSVELKGSRADKLQTLDTLTVYLQWLRRRLAGEPDPRRSTFEGPSPLATASAWPWFAAGVVVTVAVLLLFVLAWEWT